MPTEHNPAEHKALGTTPPPAAPAAPEKKAPNTRVLIIAGIIALVAIGGGGRMWYRSHYYVETDNAYVSGHVHPVSSRVAGVVTKLLVEDNQLVKEGDLLAELDPVDQRLKTDQIKAEIAKAQQQVVQADAQIAQAKAQASGATAQVAQSQAQLLRANQDAERYGQLYSTQMKAVSKAEVDAANATRTGAVADLNARRDAVTAANAEITAAISARDVLKAQVDVLKVQLQDADQQQAYNRIVAPVAGRVGKRTIEVGMRVSPGQQLIALVQDDVWVTANFKETQLANLRVGQPVEITVDAMDGKRLVGRVDSFAPASGAQFALLPADNATGNFTKIVQRVPVKLTFAPADIQALAGRLVPGMSVEAEVSINRGDAAPAAQAPAQAAAR